MIDRGLAVITACGVDDEDGDWTLVDLLQLWVVFPLVTHFLALPR